MREEKISSVLLQGTISGDLTQIHHQEIVQVKSDDGDSMALHRSIPLQKSVEQWLTRLQESITETLRIDIHSCVKDIDNGLPYEELVSKVECSRETVLDLPFPF